MTNAEYRAYLKAKTPRSPLGKNAFRAFVTGGLICCIGQAIGDFLSARMPEERAALWVPVCMIFLGVLFTAIGVYDKLGKHAGGGSVIPITGFANAVASAAIEFRHEGYVLGVGTKIFSIAGPVILYGTTASAVYGVILWLIRLF